MSANPIKRAVERAEQRGVADLEGGRRKLRRMQAVKARPLSIWVDSLAKSTVVIPALVAICLAISRARSVPEVVALAGGGLVGLLFVVALFDRLRAKLNRRSEARHLAALDLLAAVSASGGLCPATEVGTLLEAYPSLEKLLGLEVRDGVVIDPQDPRADELLSIARSRLLATASEGTLERAVLVRVVSDSTGRPAAALMFSELKRQGELVVEGEQVRVASPPTAYRGRSG